MHGLVLSLLMLLADGIAPTQLTGKVVDPDGNPVSGATVQVYSATPKKGAPLMMLEVQSRWEGAIQSSWRKL